MSSCIKPGRFTVGWSHWSQAISVIQTVSDTIDILSHHSLVFLFIRQYVCFQYCRQLLMLNIGIYMSKSCIFPLILLTIYCTEKRIVYCKKMGESEKCT